MGMCRPAALGPAGPVVPVGELPRQGWSPLRAFVCVAGAKVVGGPAWRVLGVGSRGRGGVQQRLTLSRGPLHAEFACRFERARWLQPSVDPRSGGI